MSGHELALVQRGAVVLAVAVTLVCGWYFSESGRFRAALTDRFLYGIPWGSVVTVVGVVSFYLFAQSGLSHWDDPITVAFRNWAYRYLPGMLTSGFAHASPSHLLSNMLATVILAPIAEYAWGHFPPTDEQTPTGTDRSVSVSAADRRPELSSRASTDQGRNVPGETAPATSSDRWTDGGRQAADDESTPVLSRPWVRALVVFPGAVVAVSLLTSLYALGWSLGFSGTVFAFLGFVLVRYPLTTVVSMVGLTGLNVVVATLREPVLRATTEPGAPGPPSWVGVNVQAHLLGFLIGVVLGAILLGYRDEQPGALRLLFATLLVVLARQLWALALGGDGVYYQYRAFGVVFVLLLSTVVTVTVAVDDERLSGGLSTVVTVLAYGWMGLVVVGAAAGIALTWGNQTLTLAVLAVVPLCLAPAIPVVAPKSLFDAHVGHRQLLIAAVLVITAIVALPSLAGNTPGIDGGAVPEHSVEVGDYHVGYGEDVEHGRLNASESGLVVVSERRYVWTVPVTKQQLAHRSNASVAVGGIGWHETVDAERIGWNVVGNDSVYVVDLVTGDQRVRSFVSPNSTADLTVANRTLSLVPSGDGFTVRVRRGETVVGTTPVPQVNESSSVAGLDVVATPRDDTTALFVETDETRVLLAEKEST